MESTPKPGEGWLGSALLVIIILGGLVAAIGAVVIVTHDWNQRQEASLAFEAIDCPSPGELSRADFLTEVHYLCGLPEHLDLHDAELARKLAAAFALHPWVERVERVQLEPGPKVSVSLCFRKPVLAVSYGGRTRAVDRAGVLLPLQASTAGLPVYDGVAKPPGEAGKPWPDVEVQKAAAKVGRDDI
jgi:hypothetical protein